MESETGLVQRAFQPLVDAAKGNPRALLALAENARRVGDNQSCLQLAEQALALKPSDPEISARARRLVSLMVPRWHFKMLHDDCRNQTFLAAIERAVEPGMKVLDIGSGSGLLAMMAARAGAAEVHSCELNPALAATARKIVERNGLSDRVTIHARHSGKLDPADMGGPADLVIAEIIGKDLVCEKVLPTMRDAARRLAKPEARFIPQSGEIRVALAHYGKWNNLDETCGFDLSQFNALHPARISIQVDDPALQLRGEPASLFAFDFGSAAPPAERTGCELVAAGGPVNGVVQWFRLKMDDTGIFENGPLQATSHSWALLFFPFAEPVSLAPGERVSIAATVARNLLQIWRN